jgi:hypothetical protein
MMIRKKNLERDLSQDSNQHFRFAYLVVSGGMLLCELVLLIVLLWKHPSLTQAQVYLFLLLSGAAVMPLVFGICAYLASISSLRGEKKDDQQNTSDSPFPLQ